MRSLGLLLLVVAVVVSINTCNGKLVRALISGKKHVCSCVELNNPNIPPWNIPHTNVETSEPVTFNLSQPIPSSVEESESSEWYDSTEVDSPEEVPERPPPSTLVDLSLSLDESGSPESHDVPHEGNMLGDCEPVLIGKLPPKDSNKVTPNTGKPGSSINDAYDRLVQHGEKPGSLAFDKFDKYWQNMQETIYENPDKYVQYKPPKHNHKPFITNTDSMKPVYKPLVTYQEQKPGFIPSDDIRSSRRARRYK